MKALAIYLALSAPLCAQCADRDEMVRQLADLYGEAPQTRGLDSHGNMVEMWASPEGGWTAIITKPNKESCVLAYGEAFFRLNPKFGKPI